MASKQRSFFDQQSSSRRQWGLPQKPSNLNQGLDYLPKPAMAVPPIAASSQSRSKLKAFQFVQIPEQASTSGKDVVISAAGKENLGDINGRSTSTTPPTGHCALPQSQKGVQDFPRAYPQTPIGRVPLAELISNGEDAFEQGPSLTPVEQVLWGRSPHSSGQTNSQATPAARRSKKRTRSSSPTTSSQVDASNHLTLTESKPSFDLNTLQRSLKTPQADPAGDLWSRYSLNTTDRYSPTGSAAPTLGNFMNSSSPQTPAKHLLSTDSGGLRRSISCGMEWPTSVAKRRKIQKGGTQAEATTVLASPERDIAVQGYLKMSRVSFLLEKIHDGLANPTEEEEISGPSSSSPLPDKGVVRRVHVASSSRLLESAPDKVSSECNNHDTVAKKGRAASSSPTHAHHKFARGRPQEKDSSSDFGDDDIDLDVLHAVDASMQASLTSPNHQKTPALTVQPPVPRFPVPERGQTRYETGEDDEDEFDEEDSQVFAADLEDVVAMYDQQFPNESSGDRGTCTGGDESRINSGPATVVVAHAGKQDASLAKANALVEISSDDEFGDDLDFEQIASEYESATQGAITASHSQSSNCKKPSTIQRYLVVTLAESQYQTDKGHNCPEKVLLVEEEKTKTRRVVILRQSWFDSPCTPGSFVHIIGDFDNAGQCIIDDANNMLILHPDHLISATVVADSFSCTRRAVLQDRVKATNESNEPQVYGHILHEIFQEAMKANRWDSDWLAMTIEAIASRYLETLFEINVEMAKAIEYLKSKMPELQVWAELFVTARPKADAIVKDRNGGQALMSVNKLLDVEEHIWSPMYGLKGNVDATVQVVMKDGDEERTLTVPFEVKTGRNNSNAAHKAQTALYTLLLSDRYDINIAYGILYYMETSQISRIPAIRHEVRHMVMQRNELACYVRHRLELPPMLKSPHLCGKCYAKVPCFVYHRLVDDGDGETSGLKEKFEEVVKHLKPIHQEFFKRWDDLLTKEETDVLKFRRELWTMLSSEREKVGRCFGNVVIEPGSALELTDAPKINRFRYTFIKHKPSAAFSFTESQITVGEPIVISDEKGHFALANGFVTHIRRQRITVAVDRRLHNARVRGEDFDEENNQSFTGIMEIVDDGVGHSTLNPRAPKEQVLYRLDKDEFSNGMATVRNNLIRVMEKDLFGAQALRKLIIEAVPPIFRPIATACNVLPTASQASLNVDQRNAIEKVMSAKDYALVLGMPGTGKTTTIAHIIRALTAQGKSVLLTSYTHTAVDNILLKIRNDNIGILRLGAVAKVHPEVQAFADLAGIPKRTARELERSYSQQVVATTCLGINHPIFNQRIFDYCIVDEASQITLPVCIGPIRMARTFVLVGDHYQLPPLVQNKDAQEGGLDISLFKLLSDKQPSSVVNLEHQYRMCEDIMSLSNTLIYNGRLKCGTHAVAISSIKIPNMDALKYLHHSPDTLSASQRNVCLGPSKATCWIRSLLDPSVKVAFINTDPLAPLSHEIARGSRITNPIEATLCTQLVESLLTVGISPTDIGVITLYRSQLALLKQNLVRHGRSANASSSTDVAAAAVEMHTADKFQGRDKEVVVLSLVRSNDAGNVGDLLKDWRRVNVALTRARTKLLIVGSRETLRKGNELLAKFLDLVEEKRWRFDFPVGGLDTHCFEDGSTPVVMTGKAKTAVGCGGDVGGGKKAEVKESEMTTGRVVKTMGGKNKMPEKTAKVDGRALLGSRPVLRDIVNDARCL